jgi:4-amino-4-deoxychorismate lyase
MPQSVVRITLTRGMGMRGYAPPPSPLATRVVAAFAPPAMEEDHYARGIRMRVCSTRLAEQPLLAGMKHLNRLEQVLARAEWNDPAIAEGLLCDGHGRAISATMANLFAVVDGRLVTPAVDRCGVAGVARTRVLAMHADAQVRELPLAELLRAEEVFLSSSVRGILPVRSLDAHDYVPGAVTRQLQQQWHNLGFSMEQGG